MCSRVLIKSCSQPRMRIVVILPQLLFGGVAGNWPYRWKACRPRFNFPQHFTWWKYGARQRLTDLSVSPLTERILVFSPSVSVCALFLPKKNPFKLQVSPLWFEYFRSNLKRIIYFFYIYAYGATVVSIKVYVRFRKFGDIYLKIWKISMYYNLSN